MQDIAPLQKNLLQASFMRLFLTAYFYRFISMGFYCDSNWGFASNMGKHWFEKNFQNVYRLATKG
jgi:hypothetical protein